MDNALQIIIIKKTTFTLTVFKNVQITIKKNIKCKITLFLAVKKGLDGASIDIFQIL